MRLIDAEEAIRSIVMTSYSENDEEIRATAKAIYVIEHSNTILEFEGDINKVIVKGKEYHRIVRCKDCKYYKKTSDGFSYCYDHDDDILWQDDDYCSRGRANEQNCNL